jgi:hypothetical protein
MMLEVEYRRRQTERDQGHLQDGIRLENKI